MKNHLVHAKVGLIVLIVLVSGVCRAETFTLGDFLLQPQKGLELSEPAIQGRDKKVLMGWKDYELGFYLTATPLIGVESVEKFWQYHDIHKVNDAHTSVVVVDSGAIRTKSGLAGEYKVVSISNKGKKSNQIIYAFVGEGHAFSVDITFLDESSGDQVLKTANQLFNRSKLQKAEAIATRQNP